MLSWQAFICPLCGGDLDVQLYGYLPELFVEAPLATVQRDRIECRECGTRFAEIITWSDSPRGYYYGAKPLSPAS